MRVLVVGASGMIGSAMFRVLNANPAWKILGSIRSDRLRAFFPAEQRDRLLVIKDVTRNDQLDRALEESQPDVVVNCVGLTKHHKEADDPLQAIPLNALLPHRLAGLCETGGARLIHVSTDCVFSGSRGSYCETDAPDAIDMYGRSKSLGEVTDRPHALTLRTSTIGHELQSAYGLLEWFLSQEGTCKGFGRAIFSGLPSCVFAEVVRDEVIPRPELNGLYHVSAEPINKHHLLELIARQYDKKIDIIRDNNFVIDRSLNSGKFTKATSYRAPLWPELIRKMHSDKQG